MKKKTAVIVLSYLICAVVALGALALVQSSGSTTRSLALSYTSEQAFGQLEDSLESIDTAMQKFIYVSSPAMESALCAEIYGNAMSAQMALGVLPFSTQELEKTAGFLSRIGDYALALAHSAASGKGISEEERENLYVLSQTAGVLADNTRSLQGELMNGRLSMDKLETSADRLQNIKLQNTLPKLSENMLTMESEFPETPSLIYDGHFSAELMDKEFAVLKDAGMVSSDEAKQKAAEFLGMDIKRLKAEGELESRLPCWLFSADTKGGKLSIIMTKQGGYPLSFTSSCMSTSDNLSAEDALKSAQKFLESRGFKGLECASYLINEGFLSAGFACKEGEVLCYPDMVKVTVARDTGNVCGFEASGYLSAHREREIPQPAVTSDEAKAKLDKNLKPKSSRLTLISTDGGKEILCWEFECEGREGETCLVYTDAVTGEERDILLLIEDGGGTVTI